ncbi:LOW QUALITY PROTEIN: hypothetical protein HID58_011071, partial [Brassica napus]
FYQTKFYNLRSPKTIDGHEIVSNLRQVSGCFICKRRWIMGVIVISTGPSALELYFCLIHLWEARTGSKGGALIGLERLIIDEQLNVIISVFIDKDFNPQSTTPIEAFLSAYDCKTEANRRPFFVCALNEAMKTSKSNELNAQYSINRWLGLLFLFFYALIPVYDNNDQAVFVLLGDAGRELTGKHASGLVDKYFELAITLVILPNSLNLTKLLNVRLMVILVLTMRCLPVPQTLIDTIGQTHRFKVEVFDYKGRTQAIAVMKVVSPAVLQPLTAPVGIPLATTFKLIRVRPSKTGDLADEENASTSTVTKHREE